jgi:hypothetical protein
VVILAATFSRGQGTDLIEDPILQAIIQESSGELALQHFENLLAYSGYAPSRGAEQTARYLVERSKDIGLTQIRTEEFLSDGRQYAWAFRTEPWWEARLGELWLIEPERERLASFDIYRGHLARFSTTSRVTAELVDIGSGMYPSDYDGKEIAGKIVLATGRVGTVHRLAVWERGAAGVLIYRSTDHLTYPDLVHSLSIEPYEGPVGEAPTFAFSLSCRAGNSLSDRLRNGEKLTLRAEVDADTRAGYYPQVHAVIPGTEPEQPEVWILAHTNHRNTGGGNNLTGVGATLDVARTLEELIKAGKLARPRRNIRFVWGAEHIATTYYFHDHPEAVDSVLALLNLDMVGDHQVLSESILRLYRTPHSLPHFVNDVVQEMFEVVAAGNSYSLAAGRRLLALSSKFERPIVEPSGSRDPFYYQIEPFWGPSDHEDVAEASLSIPAVLLNTWPDPYIATQEDSVERTDATQMKRAIVITAASAYIMASAGPGSIPALVQNGLAKARSRLAREEHRATRWIGEARPDSTGIRLWQARNIIRQAYRREAEALLSLGGFAENEMTRSYLSSTVTNLDSMEAEAQLRLREHTSVLARMRRWNSVEPVPPQRNEAAHLVPTRNTEIRGPINFFRPQYGRDWMTQKLDDHQFVDKVRLARFGHYYLYETLNFVNGQRNVTKIQERVAAEYGLAPLDEIVEYFQLLEKAGVISLNKP